jgi:hypothetical protein
MRRRGRVSVLSFALLLPLEEAISIEGAPVFGLAAARN